ncbi:hypothetical protein ACQP1G_13230 [Nocardia sp. CA-107356]|uniref:hypothetical protein n=1 Tax=Nocardia sp. CA-107356 TaxID=3239972 RepID=UPI003D8BBBEF
MSTEPDVRGEHSTSDNGSSNPETTHQEIPERRRRLSGELGRLCDAVHTDGH